MNVSLFIGPRLRSLALAMGGALLGIGVFLPDTAPYATPAGVAALFVGGLALQVPEWAMVRPLLPATLIPAAVAVAQALQHPEKLPIPEELKPWAPVAAGLLAMFAGKVLPVHGTYPTEADRSAQARRDALAAANAQPIEVQGSTLTEVLEKASKSGGAVVLLCCLAGLGPLSGCAAGPARQSIQESLSGPAGSPSDSSAEAMPEISKGVASAQEPKASPFSAGFALAVGIPFKSGEVVPAQLLVGEAKVASVGQRSVSLLAVGGLSGTSISQAQAAWGGGAAFELTPGTFLYQVDASAGVFWTPAREGPLAFLGFTVIPKM